MSTEQNTQLIRGLGLTAAISVNVANIIGTGVFLKARVMTCNVRSPAMALTVWLVAGLLSLAGALTYAELLAMMPRAAGEYGIMRDAYGRASGFIYGWTQFAIARSASAAALAVGFSIFLNTDSTFCASRARAARFPSGFRSIPSRGVSANHP